ncbi:MAG: cysteine--tRNA ligase [Candidatus Terraquivivens tikiterensis]|uniref:Cysteine--tRNA ligase n=1 Tax=Candidatus Terraquivivens tikiterensis TaxID=1980982 RepID=A0A2R7Y871_9ARCH|nr:MAG: cysteine--tRNA ligase [Candidatus Terraquivivens tikiterensis]
MIVLNSSTQALENFQPLHGNKVYMYVCGPTTYDYSHIGHARTYVAYDTIAKYLRYKGYSVFFLMNITDVDDKIIDRAREEGTDPLELARKYEKYFFEDLAALKIDSINYFARASEYIPEIVKSIQQLLNKGYAYETRSGIFFDTEKFPYYGALSGKKPEELTVHRIEPDPTKRRPQDFALWKKREPGEFGWETPLGYGRPGWHVEDVVIILSHLGPQIDIHGGAIELIFPHHEAEVAIAEAVTGIRPFSKYWIHTGLLTVSGVKMSKSLGNFITIREILRRVDPEVLRFYFLSAHYRSPLDFDWLELEQAKASLASLYNFMQEISDKGTHKELTSLEHSLLEKVSVLRSKFFEAMDNDFNTPQALATLFTFVKEANKTLSPMPTINEQLKRSIINTFRELGEILGILQRDLLKTGDALLNDVMNVIVSIREDLRRNKQYELADRIRESLRKIGIILEDTSAGTKWKRILSSS